MHKAPIARSRVRSFVRSLSLSLYRSPPTSWSSSSSNNNNIFCYLPKGERRKQTDDNACRVFFRGGGALPFSLVLVVVRKAMIGSSWLVGWLESTLSAPLVFCCLVFALAFFFFFSHLATGPQWGTDGGLYQCIYIQVGGGDGGGSGVVAVVLVFLYYRSVWVCMYVCMYVCVCFWAWKRPECGPLSNVCAFQRH